MIRSPSFSRDDSDSVQKALEMLNLILIQDHVSVDIVAQVRSLINALANNDTMTTEIN